MIALMQQIRKRFEDTRSKKFQLLGFLIPSNAIKCQPPSLQGLFQEFTFLNDVAQADIVDMEWRKQAIEEPGDVKDVVSDVKFWKERLNKKNVVGELKYKNLSKVVGCLMALPFANAPVEQLFSIVKNIKTDQRNRLKRESLVGLLHTKEGMQNLKMSAHELTAHEHPKLLKMIKKVKSYATDAEANELVLNELKN